MAARVGGGHVVLHAPQHAGAVVHPVPGHLLQDVHHHFPVAPAVHQQGLETRLVGRHAEPQEVAVDPLQAGHELADGLGPRGRQDLGKLLDTVHVGVGVAVGADAAHPLRQVEVLGVVLLLAGPLDPPVNVPQADRGARHQLAVHGELEVARLLQGGVLRPDGNDEPIPLPPHLRRLAPYGLRRRRLHVGVLQQRVGCLRPAVGQEQVRGVRQARHRHAEHLHELALEEHGVRVQGVDAGNRAARAGHRDPQRGDGVSLAHVIEGFDLIRLFAEIDAGEGR